MTIIICKGTNGIKATQIGVVSRGLGCAGFNSPAVFASVKKILPWIKETVENDRKNKKKRKSLEMLCPKKKKKNTKN